MEMDGIGLELVDGKQTGNMVLVQLSIMILMRLLTQLKLLMVILQDYEKMSW